MESPNPIEDRDPVAERILVLQRACELAADAGRYAKGLKLKGAPAVITDAAADAAGAMLDLVRKAARDLESLLGGAAPGGGFSVN